ncbi:MAG: hypothetical protein IPM83_11780 [Ignavibacteria bacterium]|nr:hypothetical protein [Ignavibacteria bacterium]
MAGYGHYSFRKYRAEKLAETPVVLQDYIDVGVFAEAAKGQKLGKPLAMRRAKAVTLASNSTPSMFGTSGQRRDRSV